VIRWHLQGHDDHSRDFNDAFESLADDVE